MMSCMCFFQVFNIQEITFHDTETITFDTHKDHSKWAVSRPGGNWVCVGDINRQVILVNYRYIAYRFRGAFGRTLR